MDKIIFEIKDQIYKTAIMCKDYVKDINPLVLGLVLLIIFVLLLHRWEFKKTFTFFATIFALFIILVRLEAFFLSWLEPETASFILSLSRTVAIIVAGAVFLYFAAVKE